MGIFDIFPTSKKEKPEEQSIDDLIIEAMKQVYDPDIHLNIYEMGLIYRFDHDSKTGNVDIDMTLTSPNCPAAQELPMNVKYSVEAVEGVNEATVTIVWEPAWSPECMTEEARLELGFL